MNPSLTSTRIIDTARQWLGTPYVHQASVKYYGCDCLGLIRGIWRELIGPEPQSTPNYSSDWGEVGKREVLKNTIEKYFQKSDGKIPVSGELVLFRWQDHSIAKHLGIMTSPDRFVHAYEKSGVVESPLVRDWRKRITGIYRFPGVLV